MKKTTKTLFSLLLVLVMVFQFGAVAPLAHAESNLPDTARVNLFVMAPVDEEGKLSESAQKNGQLKDSDVLDDLATLSNVAALRENGIVLTPPSGYAVVSLYIAPTRDDDKLERVTSDFASLTDVDANDVAEIEIDASYFSSDKFDTISPTYVLYIVLASAEKVAAKAATCKEAGNEAYFKVFDEPYLLDEIPTIAQLTTHGTLTHVEAKAATENEDGNIEYWKCSVCEKYFSDAEGKTEITDKDSVVVEYVAPTTYTVTFDANGHGTAPEAQTITSGEKASEPTAPTAEGFTFGGWFTEAACENAYSFDTAVTDNVTVYAKWTENAPAPTTYTVTFDANGHGTAPEAQTITSGEKASEPTAPTAEGFTFGGWFTEAAFENAYSFDTAVTDNVTVYAKWTENAPAVTNVTLSFDANGGSGEMAAIQVESGKEYEVPACTFTAPENKEFAYWLRGDEHLKPGDKDTITTDNALVAMWKDAAPAEESFTVTFDANGHGTAPAAQTVKSGEKASEPTALTAEGFTFGGWFTEAACTNAYSFDTAVSANVTVYAKWTEKAPAIIKEGTDTEWKPGSTAGLKIHIDAVYSDSLKDTLVVKVGDTVVPKDKYTVTNGSVTITIDPSYLSTLPAGDHTVSITFPSGNTVSTTVTIPAAAPGVTALAFAIDEKGFTKVYDGKSFDLNALKNYITLTNLPAGHKADIEITFETASVTEFHNVGTTTLKLHLKGVKDSADADVTSAFSCEDKTGVKLEITKRKIGVETRDDSKVYDGKAWSYTHMSNPQPIMTYPDAKLGEYVRDGKTYVQTISIKYTSSPKNMGTYENKAELIIREKEKGSSEAGTDVTSNYEVTYKFGKIKITDSKGNVPTTGVATGDANNIWIWVGVMAAAVILVVVLLFVMRKNKKNGSAQTE